MQQLPDSSVLIRDAIRNDLYHFRNGELTGYIDYDIQGDRLSEFANVDSPDVEYTITFTAQDKGNYILTQWEEKEEEYWSLYKKDDRQFSITREFISGDLPVIWRSVITDTNRPDIFLFSFTGDKVADILASADTPEPAKAKLRELTAGMTEQQILDMNPVLELLYVKK
jgi:hypothetical protein